MENLIEKKNFKITKSHFIKSYEVLNYLNTSKNGVKLIELILSYQYNDKEFFMSYVNIGCYLKCTTGSVANLVSKLRALKYIRTVNSKNYSHLNKTGAGSSTKIYVNQEYILEVIDEAINKTNNLKENIFEPIINEVIETPSIKSDNKPNVIESLHKAIDNTGSNNKEIEIIPTSPINNSKTNKPLPVTLYTNRSKSLDFNEVVSYFFNEVDDADTIKGLEEYHIINEWSSTIKPLSFRLSLSSYDIKNGTNFKEQFDNIKIEMRAIPSKKTA